MFLSSTRQNNPYNYPLWKDTRKLAERNQNFIHWNAMHNKILWGAEEMILIKETNFSTSVRSWFLILEKVGTSFTSEMAQSSFFFFLTSPLLFFRPLIGLPTWTMVRIYSLVSNAIRCHTIESTIHCLTVLPFKPQSKHFHITAKNKTTIKTTLFQSFPLSRELEFNLFYGVSDIL